MLLTALLPRRLYSCRRSLSLVSFVYGPLQLSPTTVFPVRSPALWPLSVYVATFPSVCGDRVKFSSHLKKLIERVLSGYANCLG